VKLPHGNWFALNCCFPAKRGAWRVTERQYQRPSATWRRQPQLAQVSVEIGTHQLQFEFGILRQKLAVHAEGCADIAQYPTFLTQPHTG
jgi:hypothetical protein